MSEDIDTRRRRVLQTVGAGVGTAGMATTVSGSRSEERIIGFESGGDLSVANELATSVKQQLDFGSVGDALVGEFDESALKELAALEDVRYIERNGQMHALGVRADDGDVTPAEETVPYGIETVDADETVSNGVTGEGVTIAVVDTGIDVNHETLGENVVGGYATDSAECAFECDAPYDDDQGHGSHVAGTAAGAKNGVGVYGVAPDADLLAVKALNFFGSGNFDEIAEGVNWAVDNGADVVNMSLGGAESQAVTDAIQNADANGVVVAVAAGNDGECSDCVSPPADVPEAIAVSATNKSDDIAEFSSTGPEIDVAAPGANVLSSTPDDEYEEFSGTSMACPHVAGASAAVLSSGVTPGNVLSALKNGAEDVGLSDNEQGAGRINVANSVGDGGGPPPEPDPVAVSTGGATGVGETSATLNGTLDSLDGYSDADVFFEYGPAGSGLPNVADAGTASAGEDFSASVSGLDSGTAYEFVAVAAAGDGAESDEGSVSSFETDEEMGFCFITTATADDTETLDSLRRFRDDSMRATPVGSSLVGLYYRISPPIARTLDRHPDSPEAGLTRRLVGLCASLSDRQAATDSRLQSGALGVLLTVLYLVGLLVGVAGHASLRARETLAR